ncbi:hypothetical protein Salat_1676200 [Sesamum alatum]|uniref:Uncharacterized protein n=1 Tax=Sesamum alatum TaxID=300844 RepID=A0AAE1Y6X5_9LAMI|nr:hypothetical protein Salat_1676200 [Sesamum alatum]
MAGGTVRASSGLWKSDLIDDAFSVEDAECTKAIPPSILRASNRPVWLPKKNDRFTVRSAHHLAVSLKDIVVASSSNPFYDRLEICTFWKSLWKRRIPQRLKESLGFNEPPLVNNFYMDDEWRELDPLAVVSDACRSLSEFKSFSRLLSTRPASPRRSKC